MPLTSLNLECCDWLSETGLVGMGILDKSLTFLDVSDCDRLSDEFKKQLVEAVKGVCVVKSRQFLRPLA